MELVAEMSGRRISRVIVEDIAPPPSQIEDEADSREAIQ
jgi:putative hemolysin